MVRGRATQRLDVDRRKGYIPNQCTIKGRKEQLRGLIYLGRPQDILSIPELEAYIDKKCGLGGEVKYPRHYRTYVGRYRDMGFPIKEVASREIFDEILKVSIKEVLISKAEDKDGNSLIIPPPRIFYCIFRGIDPKTKLPICLMPNRNCQYRKNTTKVKV